MEAGCEEDCLSALSEACPRGKKDSEFIAGRVGILSPKKGEMLKACCVGVQGLMLHIPGTSGGALRKQEGGVPGNV